MWRLVLAGVLVNGYHHVVAPAKMRVPASQPQEIFPWSVESDRRDRGGGIGKDDAARPINPDHTPDEIENPGSCIAIVDNASVQRGGSGQMNDFVRTGAHHRSRERQATQVRRNFRVLPSELIGRGSVVKIIRRTGGTDQCRFVNSDAKTNRDESDIVGRVFGGIGAREHRLWTDIVDPIGQYHHDTKVAEPMSSADQLGRCGVNSAINAR